MDVATPWRTPHHEQRQRSTSRNILDDDGLRIVSSRDPRGTAALQASAQASPHRGGPPVDNDHNLLSRHRLEEQQNVAARNIDDDMATPRRRGVGLWVGEQQRREEYAGEFPAPPPSSPHASGPAARSFVVRVVVADRATGGFTDRSPSSRSPSPNRDSAGGGRNADPSFPMTVVLSVTATSMRSLVDQVEAELRGAHGLHFRVSAFQYTTYDGRGAWQSVPTIADEVTGSRVSQTPPPSVDHSPVHLRVGDAVLARQQASQSALSLPPAPTPERVTYGSHDSPLPRQQQQQLHPSRFQLLPDRFTMRITPAARRLSFTVTTVLPTTTAASASSLQSNALHTSSGGAVVQRRAAAAVTTMKSLMTALSAVCQFRLDHAQHRILFHDDAAGGYRPLSSVAQLPPFSVLMVDLSDLANPAAFAIAVPERIAPHSAGSPPKQHPRADHLNSTGVYEPRTKVAFHDTMEGSGVVHPVSRGELLGGIDQVDHNARARAGIVVPPYAVSGNAERPEAAKEHTVPKVHKPSRATDTAARFAPGVPFAAADDKMSASLRFRVPRTVKTPAASHVANLPSTLPPPPAADSDADDNNGVLLDIPPDMRREELESFGLSAADVCDIANDPEADAALVDSRIARRNAKLQELEQQHVSSVLPRPVNDSPAREGLDLARAAAWEGAARFPHRSAMGGDVRRPTNVRTPASGHAAAAGPGPRAVIEYANAGGEKSALIHEGMQMVMAHSEKDLFPFGDLVRILSDVVQRFRQGYPERIAIRFPLTRNDEATLREMVDSSIKQELLSRVGEGFVPFQDSAQTRRQVERARLLNSHGKGLPVTLAAAAPNFASVSPDRAAADRQLAAALPADPSHGSAGHNDNVTYENADTPPSKRLPQSWEHAARRRPELMLTRPQYDRSTDTLVFYATTSLDLFGLTSAAIAQQRRAKEALLNVQRTQSKSDDAAFRWFITKGGLGLHGRERTQDTSSDVPVDAMIDLGIARVHVLQHTVPVSLSLEISLVRRVPTGGWGEDDADAGDWTDALQPGVPYTVGLMVRDGDGASMTKTLAFTIPTSFRPSKHPMVARAAAAADGDGDNTPARQPGGDTPASRATTASSSAASGHRPPPQPGGEL